ncbi:hypothetical protein [Undibacterium sp.]|uniref:hypothetical protein n=1 Tax=Undibacterium sp. TaxID=1914977 RepID=UPI0025F33567|nr:hypothetical protein [Undibacterium sp.]
MNEITPPIFILLLICNSIINALLVLRLKNHHSDEYGALGSPSIFYFIGVEWMLNFSYFSWIWTSKYKKMEDKKIITYIWSLRTLCLTIPLWFIVLITDLTR